MSIWRLAAPVPIRFIFSTRDQSFMAQRISLRVSLSSPMAVAGKSAGAEAVVPVEHPAMDVIGLAAAQPNIGRESVETGEAPALLPAVEPGQLEVGAERVRQLGLLQVGQGCGAIAGAIDGTQADKTFQRIGVQSRLARQADGDPVLMRASIAGFDPLMAPFHPAAVAAGGDP